MLKRTAFTMFVPLTCKNDNAVQFIYCGQVSALSVRNLFYVCFYDKADRAVVKYTSELSLKRQERKIVVRLLNYIKAKIHDKSASLLVNETAAATDRN